MRVRGLSVLKGQFGTGLMNLRVGSDGKMNQVDLRDEQQ